QQRDAGDPARPLGGLEVAAELVLEHAVDALDLLLLAKLQAVAGELRLPRLAVLPGREGALLDRALFGLAALALEAQRHALAAAQTEDGSDVTSHSSFRSSLRIWGFEELRICSADPQILRFSHSQILKCLALSYPAPLRGSAPVVRDRGHVANRFHFQ